MVIVYSYFLVAIKYKNSCFLIFEIMYDIVTLTGLQVDRSFDDNFQATYAFSVTVLPSGHGGTITHIKSTLNYGETTKYAAISVLIKSK